VEGLPPGQLAPLLDKLAAGLHMLAAAGMRGERGSVCGLLLGTCLAALPLSSSTAVAAAASLRALLSQALADPLASALETLRTVDPASPSKVVRKGSLSSRF
jgi:hypothetical protein